MSASAATFVITGPSDSGKTTYVQANAASGDLVWDFDRVAAMLWNLGDSARRVDLERHQVAAVMTMFWSLVRWVDVTPHPTFRVFLIVSDRERASRIAEELGAEVVDLEAV